MVILGFDATGSAVSVVLWADGIVQASAFAAFPVADRGAGKKHFRDREKQAKAGQSEALLLMIEQVMKEGQMDFRRLDAAAAVRGPGSYTGIRTTLSVAKGLSVSLGIPAAGWSAVDCLVESWCQKRRQTDKKPAFSLVLIESRRRDLYWQVFSGARDASAGQWRPQPLCGLQTGETAEIAAAVSSLVPEGAALHYLGNGCARFMREVEKIPGGLADKRISIEDRAHTETHPDPLCLCRWMEARLRAEDTPASGPAAGRPTTGGPMTGGPVTGEPVAGLIASVLPETAASLEPLYLRPADVHVKAIP